MNKNSREAMPKSVRPQSETISAAVSGSGVPQSEITRSAMDGTVMALSDCILCPRSCHADRLRGKRGFCGEAGTLRAARAALYFTEEPVISGSRGSGTVFFAGCNLGCVYCQNKLISRPGRSGTCLSADRSGDCFTDREESGVRIKEISPERLTEIFFELEAQGAHNINLVTPEHFVPLLIPALKRAKAEGLSIPVVYNTGSYERVEAVKALEGLVDIWLPDLKYVSSALSSLHTGAADYFTYASAAIAEMVRQCPDPVFSDGSHSIDCQDDVDDPLMVRGVIVRHLALPGCGGDSRSVLRYLYETYGDHIFISIMNQYTPMRNELIKKDPEMRISAAGWDLPQETGIHPDLGRCLFQEEYDSLVDYAIDLGIQNGFIQESGTVSPSYIPRFDGTGL